MILTTDQLEELVAQARREAPNEACGVIGGLAGRAIQVYALKNVDDNPRVRYLADPRELLNAVRDIEETHGWDLLAIYHSHPASPAFPSPTDVERAFYPEAVYIIISLMNPEAVDVRAFQIKDARVNEVTLEIHEGGTREQAGTNPRRHQATARGPSTHRTVAPLSQRRPRSGKAGAARRRVSK